MFSIFGSFSWYLTFDSKIKDIPKVIKCLGVTKQRRLLSKCLKHYNSQDGSSKRYEIAMAYLHLLSVQKYSENEISEIIEKNLDTINSMLFLVASDQQAKDFYKTFRECQNLLSVDVRLLYCELEDLDETQQWNLLCDIIQMLESFDESKNMIEYLVALEILLSLLINTKNPLEEVKVKIAQFGGKHQIRINQELMKEEGLPIFSGGALLSVFKSDPMMLDIDVKYEYRDILCETNKVSVLWMALDKYLKELKKSTQLSLERKVSEIIKEIKERDNQYQSKFVVKYKTIVDDHNFMKSLSVNTQLLRVFLSIPKLLSVKTKHRLLKYMSICEQYDWLEQCFTRYRVFPATDDVMKMIDDVCVSIGETNNREIDRDRMKKITDKKFHMGVDIMIPKKDGKLEVSKVWLKPTTPRMMSLQIRIATLQLNSETKKNDTKTIETTMELVRDMMSELEKFEDWKHMFDYLVTLDMLLPTLFDVQFHFDFFENAKKKIFEFAFKHITMINNELLKDDGFLLFSRGALLLFLKNGWDILDIDVKYKYRDILSEGNIDSYLWNILGEYIKTLASSKSTPFEKNLPGYLLELKREARYEIMFVEKYKTQINCKKVIDSITENSPLRSFLLSIPNLLNVETKQRLLKSINRQHYDWLDKCFTKYKTLPVTDKVLLLIDDVCAKINQNCNKIDIERTKTLAEKHIRLIIGEILPKAKEGFVNLQKLLLSNLPIVLSLQLRLTTLQSILKRRNFETYPLTVNRNDLLGSSYNRTIGLTTDDWRTIKFKIAFENEAGVDLGGLLKEWFTTTTREILNPNFGLFIPTPGDVNSYMINRSSDINEDHLQYFKFIGRFLAKGILENINLACPLTNVLVKHISGTPVKYSDFKVYDPEFFNSLKFILNNPISETGLELTFSTKIEHFGTFMEEELVTNGKNIQVTDENKHEYVKLITEMKMTESIRPQLDEFRAGFYDVIPKHFIKIFGEKDLEMMLCGQSDIDIDDLKANTLYNSYHELDDVIQWFWKALRSFDNEDRGKFLMFVTGSSRAPLTGFADLRGSHGVMKFNICDNFNDEGRLPTAHTCSHQLDLPQYSSYKILRSKLLLAIREGNEGFGMA